MAFLELKNVSKSFGTGRAREDVLKGINLSMEEGEFVAIVGYSGVGKSTLMNMIAGLVAPGEGTVHVGGKPVLGPDPDRGLVFQNYSLLPWLTVHGNVATAVNQVFGSEKRPSRFGRVREAIEQVNLSPAVDKRPAELSGGMRQRVSVARTLSTKPKVMLLDEPLSALDAITRASIQDQILDIWEAEKQTIILITNDVDEGLYLADRVIPLSLGPGATFGPETVVDLPRPRDRRAMNNDPRYREMRNDIIHYLLDIKAAETDASPPLELTLPDVHPMDITDAKRSAFRGQEIRKNRRHKIPTA